MKNGYVLAEGFSPYDGNPVMHVITGLVNPSKNPKTGPMVQSWFLRRDIPPDVAVKNGWDGSVCGTCNLRPVLARKESERRGLGRGEKLPCCYVTPNYAPLAVFNGVKRGIYPSLPDPNDWHKVLKGKDFRLGSYGNPSVFPLSDTATIAAVTHSWRGYVHDWATCDQEFSRYCMASVSSAAEKAIANQLGWRTFRVRRENEVVLPDEVVCPASDEAGKKTTCNRCPLCKGNSVSAKNVVIVDHGPTSQSIQRKRRPLKVLA